MTEQEMIAKLKNTKTMPELDGFRLEVTKFMMAGGKEAFYRVQKEFIKTKNRLKRIPLMERTW